MVGYHRARAASMVMLISRRFRGSEPKPGLPPRVRRLHDRRQERAQGPRLQNLSRQLSTALREASVQTAALKAHFGLGRGPWPAEQDG